MLLAKLTSEGVLEICATEGVESYALSAWQKSRKAGKSKLVILDKPTKSLEEITAIMSRYNDDLQKWRKERLIKIREGNIDI